MAVIVTGAAGFIGYHVADALLKQGREVIGIDNLNSYYDPALKQARLDKLTPHKDFTFHKGDIADKDAMHDLFMQLGERVTGVIHLAAQAGVRYSLENPYAYVQSNVMGQVVMLEAARLYLPRLKHFVYASSSSVYGANTKQPFSTNDPVEKPVSIYAATKRADELITRAYCHLWRIPATGLRFFTVYGPWGRPDMATYLFADAISQNKPVKVFNEGQMRRDFTYIDDVVAGTLNALKRPPAPDTDGVAHKIYNLGNNQPVKLMDFIGEIEKAMGKTAQKDMLPMQQGDVVETYADIDASKADLDYAPKTPLSEGIPRFVDWYKAYHGV